MLARDTSLKPFSNATLTELRKIIGIDWLKVTHIQRPMSNLENVVL